MDLGSWYPRLSERDGIRESKRRMSTKVPKSGRSTDNKNESTGPWPFSPLSRLRLCKFQMEARPAAASRQVPALRKFRPGLGVCPLEST